MFVYTALLPPRKSSREAAATAHLSSARNETKYYPCTALSHWRSPRQCDRQPDFLWRSRVPRWIKNQASQRQTWLIIRPWIRGNKFEVGWMENIPCVFILLEGVICFVLVSRCIFMLYSVVILLYALIRAIDPSIYSFYTTSGNILIIILHLLPLFSSIHLNMYIFLKKFILIHLNPSK